MKLSTVDFSSLHLPQEEWRWLRPSIAASTIADDRSPDSFLWCARVTHPARAGLPADALWAWHPKGSSLDVQALRPGTRVRVLELESDGTEREAHALYLRTVFAAQAAHDVEWSAALCVLNDRFGVRLEDSGLPRHWDAALSACGLEAHLGVLAQRRKFCFLNIEEMKLVCERRWDPSTLELLESTPAQVRAAFLAAIRKWNLTAGHAREALNAVSLLARRMGEKTALAVMGSSYSNAEEFRSALLTTSQPALATLSRKRLDMLRGLNVPPRCSVFGDPAFESDILKITHTPRKMADFELFRQWVADPETVERIRELLEIYQ